MRKKIRKNSLSSFIKEPYFFCGLILFLLGMVCIGSIVMVQRLWEEKDHSSKMIFAIDTKGSSVLPISLGVIKEEGIPAENQENSMNEVSPLYNAKGLKDPFSKPSLRLNRSVIGAERVEKVDFSSQYKLVGIVTGDGKNMAMIEDLQGRGFIVTEGSSIEGLEIKVQKITSEEVTMEELYMDSYGEIRKKRLTLRLFG